MEKIKFILDLFRMFPSPFGISSRTYNHGKNDTDTEQKNSKSIHGFYSSLLKKNTPINSIKNTNKPIINDAVEIVSGAASFATTILTKITWAKFKHSLANASFCFLPNFINNTIQQIKMFVKQKIKAGSILSKRFSRCLSVGYGGGSILKYALLGLFALLLLSSYFGYIFAEEKINVAAEIRKLKSKKINEKLSAIEKLGKARDKKATQGLLNALKTEKNVSVKCKIIEALGNTGDDAATDELVSVIKTTENVVDIRYMAVVSLREKNEKVIQTLREVFLNETEDISLRLRALEELSLVRGNPVTFDTLIAGTEDKNPLIRRVSVGLLWQSYYPQEKDRIMPIFQKLLHDPDEEVRNSVKQILVYKPKE